VRSATSLSDEEHVLQVRRVEPAQVVIIEGILVLHFQQILERAHMKIFVDSDDDVRLARRIKRDVTERGRDISDVIHQYTRFVKPTHDELIAPSRRIADIVIPWQRGDNLVAVDLVVGHLRSHIVSDVLLSQYPNLHVLVSTFQMRGMHTIVRNRETEKCDFIFMADRLIRLVCSPYHCCCLVLASCLMQCCDSVCMQQIDDAFLFGLHVFECHIARLRQLLATSAGNAPQMLMFVGCHTRKTGPMNEARWACRPGLAMPRLPTLLFSRPPSQGLPSCTRQQQERKNRRGGSGHFHSIFPMSRTFLQWWWPQHRQRKASSPQMFSLWGATSGKCAQQLWNLGPGPY
jgi:hypothetical protein